MHRSPSTHRPFPPFICSATGSSFLPTQPLPSPTSQLQTYEGRGAADTPKARGPCCHNEHTQTACAWDTLSLCVPGASQIQHTTEGDAEVATARRGTDLKGTREGKGRAALMG